MLIGRPPRPARAGRRQAPTAESGGGLVIEPTTSPMAGTGSSGRWDCIVGAPSARPVGLRRHRRPPGRAARTPRRTTAASSWIDVTARALRLDRLDDRRGGQRRVLAQDPQPPAARPPDLGDAGAGPEAVRVDVRWTSPPRGTARRTRAGAASRVAQRDQPAAGDQRDHVALLGLGDVLGGDHERPARVAQAMQLVPDRLADDRVDAGGRLVEEDELRIVHERARELEAAPHAARQPAGPPVRASVSSSQASSALIRRRRSNRNSP